MAQIPSTSPNARQVAFSALGYGMFIHFGINTPNEQEWSDGSLAVSTYNVTGPDCAQWVATARAAGFKYIIFTSKHHDGFTLWNSADTTYGITTPGAGNTTDVVGALAAACAADEAAHPGRGIKLSLYYSPWDRKRNADIDNVSLDAAYNAVMLSHLTELLTNYGPIASIWADGFTVKDGTRWGIDAIYDLMQSLQPNCVFNGNHAIGSNDLGSPPATYPAGDIRIFNQNAGDGLKWSSDYRSDDGASCKHGAGGGGSFSSTNLPDPKTFVRNSQTFFLPWEATYTILSNGNWFYHSNNSSNFASNATLVDLWAINKAQGNNMVFNVAPTPAGIIDSDHVTKLNSLATALGLSSGAGVFDYAEGKTATASTTFSSDFEPAYALTGQTEGPRWAAANGDTTNPWIYVDLGSAQYINRVMLKEWSADANARTTAISVQTSDDASNWITRTTASGTGTWLRYGVFSFTPVTARYVRVLCTTVVNPPSFWALRVYGPESIPSTGSGLPPCVCIRRR